MAMKTLASILLLSAGAGAFSAPPATARPAASTSSPSSTALNHINTRKRIENQELGIWQQTCQDYQGNYVPCDAICGHDVRSSWESYAPPHGSPPSYGAIGCPGGGDWCYANSFGAAGPITGSIDAKKKAATVAAALAGLGSGVAGSRSVAAGSIPKGSLGVGKSSPAVMGEDAREARGSYAPWDSHDGRVGALGEIGAGGDGGGSAGSMAMPSGKQVGSTGDYFTNLGGFSEPPPPKRYGLGSWQK